MSSRQEVSDEVIYVRSAGLDLGKRLLVACVRVPSETKPGSWALETERFGTTADATRRLAQWLIQRRVEVVALEAASHRWWPPAPPAMTGGRCTTRCKPRS